MWESGGRRGAVGVLLAVAVVAVLGALPGALPGARALSATVFCELPDQGVLRGAIVASTVSNASFAAFEGVPYAEPPLGPLRFQPPRPAVRFVFREARSRRLPCPLLNDKGFLVGAEDCLYLNVYTPAVDEALGLPVLVVLPGEDWSRGYAGRWQPHRVLDRGIVVVTVQSRLGALGFLTSGNAAAPGNLGLRDEALALAWVNKYIRHFGGDPDRVTVAGVGAGAAAAMLHALSPMSAGLFRGVIAVGGSALSPWSLAEASADPAGPARRLGDVLGCHCANATATATVIDINSTSTDSATTSGTYNVTTTATAAATTPVNISEVLECLRSKTVADIVYGTARLQLDTAWLGLPPSPFGPVVERDLPAGVSAFLDDTPSALWAQGRAASVPMLVGLARSEGLQALAPWPSGGLLNSTTLLTHLDANWTRLAPLMLAFNSTAAPDRDAAAEQLRRHYLPVGPVAATPAPAQGASASASASASARASDTPTGFQSAAAKDGLVRMYGDRHVVVPALRASLLHAANQTVYLYRFSWRAATGSSSLLSGPAGGNDASLLLMQPMAREEARLPAQHAMARDILDIWAGFVLHGSPKLHNKTLPANTNKSSSLTDLAFTDLVGPGEQHIGNWSAQELFTLWSSLPLLENKSPGPPQDSGSAPGKESDTAHHSGSSRPGVPEIYFYFAISLLPVCYLYLFEIN